MIPVILFEDNHCLALDKPAGMLTQGDRTGDPSLVDWARDDLKRRFQKPHNVYVGLLHRVDRPVSGIVLLAKTSKAAARLSRQFHDGEVEKVYLAVAEGSPRDDAGRWIDWLMKDEQRNVVHVVSPETPGAKKASLDYRVVDRKNGRSTLELRPNTGRSHQLRVQLASRRLPILGDRKYGSTLTLSADDGGWRIALHSQSLTFRHPTRGEPITIRASEPADWPV
jgi:23S rRNA pseudouridine1911/1915/1917 synthase